MNTHSFHQTENYSELDINKVKKRISENIRSYRRREISLKELVRQVEIIKNSFHLPTKIEDIISVLKSLSIIDDILTDILQELQE